MEFDLAMVGLAIILFAAGVLTYLMQKYVDYVSFLKDKVRDAKKFLESHEGDVPEEFKGLFASCMATIEDLENAMIDNKISYREIIDVAKDILAMVEELKQAFKK